MCGVQGGKGGKGGKGGIKETLWTGGIGGVVYGGYLLPLNCPHRKAGHTPTPKLTKTGRGGSMIGSNR